MKKWLCIAVLASMSTMAWAERHIHLNGEHLNYDDMVLMDQLFGYQVADGFYWLNTETGQWGYEESEQVQGTLDVVRQYHQQNSQPQNESQKQRQQAEINSSQNGSVVTGTVNGQNCTYASAGGMTFKTCD